MDRPALNGSPQLGSGASLEGRAHGQAALLLVESLMHSLLNKGVISREDFIDTVEGAAEVEHEFKTLDASSPTDSNGSLLYPLAASFRKELGR